MVSKPAPDIQRDLIVGTFNLSGLSTEQVDAILNVLVGHTRREWTEIEAGIILSSLIAKGKDELNTWANQLLTK